VVEHDRPVRLADLVATSQRVAATGSRTAKVGELAETIRRFDPDELEAGVAMLAGEPRQGKVGVGWATLSGHGASAAGEPTLSVGDLDEALDRLVALTGPGSAAARQAALTELFDRATEVETSFVYRLFGGELRQGATAGFVTEAVAKAFGAPAALVRRAAMLTGDLGRTAALASTGGLDAVGLEVLRPVQPMLAATSPDAASAVRELGLSSVEWKLDGARVQAHRSGGEVRLFTRNLNDVTHRMPSIAGVVASLPVHDVVLDGEVLGVGDDERPEAFQTTMSSFGRDTAATGPASLTVMFFDVLHVDGEDLLDAPLTDRRARLEQVVGAWRVPSVLTDDPDEAEAFFAGAIAAGHEGVVVKGAGSRYEAGRRGQAWRKVKPVVTLDLVVLAAEWGHGRRRGRLSNLHLGARDPDGGFVMVGKTFKGLTDALLAWQTEALLAIATERTDFVVRVRPELVVEIAIDGVQRSSRYGGGVVLRFARVRRYRPDRTPDGADTIDTLRRLGASE
jgi:DNA ligase-1